MLSMSCRSLIGSSFFVEGFQQRVDHFLNWMQFDVNVDHMANHLESASVQVEVKIDLFFNKLF